MITTKDFNDRCDRLFDSMRLRFKPRYWKSGKRKGMMKSPGRDLPFDRQAIRSLLGESVGFHAISCPYCGRAMDILSLTLDHVIPVSRGGGLGFDNLEPVCDSCNRQKGELTKEEFVLLREFIRSLAPAAQADIQKRLKGSGRFFPKYEKKDPNTVTPARLPRYRSPQITMEEATF